MKNRILEILRDENIKLSGFCDYALVEDKLLECRAKSRIPKNAKTVIVCAFPYKVKECPPKNISRYAAVPDYHKVAEGYLLKALKRMETQFPLNSFEVFIDNSPIPEVFAAAAAGIGVKGDNGLLITEKWGSWVFLGEIVTDLKIESPNLYGECLHCGKCKALCPKEKQDIDCLSKVSQKKGELSQVERTALKKNRIVWGCDICAENCPMNSKKEITYIPEFLADYRDEYKFCEDITHRAYAWRGEGPIKRNLEIQGGEE